MKLVLRMLGLAFLTAALAASAAVYKYVDKSGEAHYTDKPVPGAHRLDLPQIQTYSPGDLPPPDLSGPDQSQGGDEGEAASESVTLVRPRPGETFRSAERSVTLSARTVPALHSQNRFMFYLDGKPLLAGPTRSNTLVIRVAARGTHHASVAVVDADGKPLARSAAVEFYMKPPVIRSLNKALPRP